MRMVIHRRLSTFTVSPQEKTNFRLTFLLQTCYKTKWAPLTCHCWFNWCHIAHLENRPLTSPKGILCPSALQGPLSPPSSRIKRVSASPRSLTTWARARQKVCRITQVFSKAERAAMVPRSSVHQILSSLSSFRLLTPPQAGAERNWWGKAAWEQGRRGGGGGGVGWWWWWWRVLVCTAPQEFHTGGRRGPWVVGVCGGVDEGWNERR